jgi:hypothetical protein
MDLRVIDNILCHCRTSTLPSSLPRDAKIEETKTRSVEALQKCYIESFDGCRSISDKGLEKDPGAQRGADIRGMVDLHAKHTLPSLTHRSSTSSRQT